MSLVLDASAALARVFGENAGAGLRQVFARVADKGAVVPGLWWLEMANSLTVAVRRERIDAAFRDAALDDFAVLDITTDQGISAEARSNAIRLADAHGLTVYDAVYLELARWRGLELATLDRPLAAAAGQVGVRVVDVG